MPSMRCTAWGADGTLVPSPPFPGPDPEDVTCFTTSPGKFLVPGGGRRIGACLRPGVKHSKTNHGTARPRKGASVPGDVPPERPDDWVADAPELVRTGRELSWIEAVLTPRARNESAADAEQRLGPDAEVVARLRRNGFTGPRYERFMHHLVHYGWSVLVAWNTSGEIFRQSSLAGRPVPPELIVSSWDKISRTEVAFDTASAGFELFRVHALERSRWSPEGGAALTTYYIGACVRAFRPVYTRWSRAYQAIQPSPADDDRALHLPGTPGQDTVDPCDITVRREEIQRILELFETPELRAGMAWRALGYTQREAAARAGMTEKAMERRLSRARRRIRGETADGDDLGRGEA